MGSLADTKQIEKDLATAIRLAGSDEDGRTLKCPGVDPKQQRLFVMCWSHHQLARLAHKARDLPRAKWVGGFWGGGC